MSLPTFRFVHAADLHLDAPFHGVRRASPAITYALGQAALTAWDALVQLTIDQNAAFLLLSGDICDGGERAVPAQLRFLQGLQRLSAHAIPTFIVRGGGDPSDRWPGIQQWPNHVHCFGAHAVESMAVGAGGERLATIHGVSHASDRSNRQFVRGVETGLHIGLLHAGVNTGSVTAGDHLPIADLQSAGMDYWALGTVHRHQHVSEGQPWIVYPGTLQGRSFKDDETGPKGAVVVTVSDGSVRDVTHHALDAVRLTRVQIDLSGLTGATDLRRALSSAAARLRSEGAGRTIIVTGELRGRAHGWMGAQLTDDLWDRLLDDLRQEDNGGEAVLWWDSLTDFTEGRELQSDDAVSMYVHRLVEVLRRAPAGLDRLLSDQSATLAPSMHAGRSTLDSHDVDHLLNRAERVALSLLEREP